MHFNKSTVNSGFSFSKHFFKTLILPVNKENVFCEVVVHSFTPCLYHSKVKVCLACKLFFFFNNVNRKSLILEDSILKVKLNFRPSMP